MPPSSSTDSLPISYRSRGSVYTSSSLHTLAADTDGLHRLLATKDITTQVIAGAFEEYAWRGLLRGTRVRDWCEGLRTLLDELHIVQELYTALQTPSIVALYPFLSLISAPSAVRAHFFYTSPTVPAQQLANLDKETLVDALLCLMEGSDFVCENDLFAPVTELVLEYIGSMWRGLKTEGQKGIAVADGIAKGLVELEFEMQCQGNRPSLRAFVFPIVRRIRFDLGFVTSFQLVSRLKAHAEHLSPTPSQCDPHHIIAAWSLRRLNTSTSPQKVYDELVFIRERIRDDAVQQVVEEVMTRLGLEKKDTQDLSDTETKSSSTDRQLPSTPSKKGFSLFSNSKKAAARKTMIALKPSPLRSSSDGRDPSSSFLDLPAGFNPDRRPSLPMISSMSYQQTRLNLSSPLKSSSLTSFQSVDSGDSADSRRSQIQTSDLLSQIMTFSEASDVRLILLDYIVETRYRLNVGGEADWYFGNGREQAASTLDTLEGRLVGKRDVMKLETVFKDIRTKFDIPAPGSPIRIGGRARRRGTINRSRERELSQDLPRDIPESRGVSFELDSYYHHHIPEEDELDQEVEQDTRTEESSSTETVKARRKSTGATSVFSLSSAISTAVQPTEGNARSSFFSTYAFSIREAKVQYPLEAIAVDQGRLQSQSDDTLERHLSVPSPYRTFFPSRSESSLADTAYTPTPIFRQRRDGLQLQHARTSPTTSTHLGLPRPDSPAGSFHSLLSALDLETSIPIDLLDMFPVPVMSPPITPLGSTGDQSRARRKQNRQYVVVDQELERSPHADFQDFPEEVSTPTLEPTRKRYTSNNSIPASLSTLDSIDEYPLARLEPRSELPLAKLLALFMDPAGPGGLAGTSEGTRPEDVRRAVEGFVSGEMRYAEELGSGWDAEDQRRVIWLLRQIAALIADPILQYPIHQQIHHLIRNPPPSSRSSLISTSSDNTVSSSSTSKYLATPPTAPRPSPQGLDVTLGSARSREGMDDGVSEEEDLTIMDDIHVKVKEEAVCYRRAIR